MLLNIIYGAAVLLIAVGLGAALRRHSASWPLIIAGQVGMAVHAGLLSSWPLLAVWAALVTFSGWRYSKALRSAKEGSA